MKVVEAGQGYVPDEDRPEANLVDWVCIGEICYACDDQGWCNHPDDQLYEFRCDGYSCTRRTKLTKEWVPDCLILDDPGVCLTAEEWFTEGEFKYTRDE